MGGHILRWLRTALLGAAVLGCLCGQPSAPREIDIYNVALIEAARAMQRERRPVEGLDPQRVVVDKDGSVPVDSPQLDDGPRFEHLTEEQLRLRRKQQKKDFAVLRVNPAGVEGPRVKVVVSLSYVGLRNGGLMLGLSGWAIVYFRLDAAQQRFQFDEVRLGGV